MTSAKGGKRRSEVNADRSHSSHLDKGQVDVERGEEAEIIRTLQAGIVDLYESLRSTVRQEWARDLPLDE